MRMAMMLTMDTSDLSLMNFLSPELMNSLISTNSFLRYCEAGKRSKGLDPVQQMLYCDTHILLPDIFLEKVDKSTMAFSIEARVPFLDNNLTTYVMG
jgi:asparagine synthase (glutamine-hydrolysing)